MADGLPPLEPIIAVGESAFCGLPPSSESLEWRELEAARTPRPPPPPPLLPGRGACGEELFLFLCWMGEDLEEKQGEGDLEAAAETVEDREIVGERVRSIGEYGSCEDEVKAEEEGVTLSDSRLETKDRLLKVGLRGGGCGEVLEKDRWRMVVLYSRCGERIGGVIGDEVVVGVVRKLEYRPPPERRGDPMGSGIPWRRLWSPWEGMWGGGGEGEALSGTRYDMPESKLRLFLLCSEDRSPPHMSGLLQCCARWEWEPPKSP